MKTDKFLIHNLVIYWLVLFLGFVCVSCSSKSDEEPNETMAPSSVASEEEAKRLKQENDDLKRALTEVVGGKEQSGRHYKDEDKVDAIIAKFNSAVSAEEKIELIKSLSELSIEQDPSVIGFVQKVLDDSEPEVGRAAIELLEGYETPEILPVIEQALNAEDEQTRIKSLRPLSGVDDRRTGELLAQALSDTSKNVRIAALEVAEEHKDSIKLGVMEEGIVSPYNDVKYEVASMLEYRGDHKAVEILIEGLKDSDSDFREEINATLDFLIDKEFKTYEEAQAWWTENKDNYDDELFLIEDD